MTAATSPPGTDDADARDAWLQSYFGPGPSLSYLQYKQRVAAAEARKLAHHRVTAAAATTAWTNIGPFAGASDPGLDASWADAGRLTAIVTHPTNNQIVYIANDGGVFKSTNADPASSTDWTWTAITDNLPASSGAGNVSVGDLAMSPADPNTLYLGLGDPLFSPSVGFFYTHDGGATWTLSTGLTNSTQVSKILPLSASVVLVATIGSGLWRSVDGAQSFTQVSVAGAMNGGYTSLESFGNGTLVLSDDNTAALFYSTDQGVTWAPASVGSNAVGGTLIKGKLALGSGSSTVGYWLATARNPASAIVFLPGLYKTTDSGHTWSYVAPSGTSYDLGQPNYNMLVTVDPDNASNVWVGTQASISRSTDGGVTWINASNWMTHADNHVAVWSKTGAKTLYIGNDGGLAVMRDPLRATPPSALDLSYVDNRHNRGVASHLIYNLSSTISTVNADGRYHVSIGTQDDGTRFRTDAGAGLASSGLFDTASTGDGFGTLYHPYMPGWVLGSINGTLYRTTDGRTLTSPVNPGALLFGVPVIPDASDVSGNGVITMGLDALYRSHDFGQTFTTVGTSGVDAGFWRFHAAVAATDGNSLAIVGNNAQPLAPGFVSSDGGATWTRMGAIDSAASPRYVWFDSRNASTLYVTSPISDPTIRHLWRSTNKGVSFTGLDTPTNGLPYGLPILGVKNDPFDSNTLYVATELGVYRTTDGGVSFARFGTGLPLVRVTDLWVAPDGSVLRVATYGRGVWEIPLGRTGNTLGATITSPTADQTVASGTTLSFTGTVTDSNGAVTPTAIWELGDGASAIGTSTTHTFTNLTASPVTYPVTFVATDASGANAGVVRRITVQPQPSFSLGTPGCGGVVMRCVYKVPVGGAVTGTISVALTVGSAQTVTLSASGLPAGVTATFNPSSVVTGNTSTMTLTASAAAVAGNYNFTIQGNNGAITQSLSPGLTLTSTNPITNGGFETGDLSGWTAIGTTSIVASGAHTGTDAAQVGGTAATNGDSAIAQTFTAPTAGGTLSFWYAVHCPDTVSYDWATATLNDTTAGTAATVLAKTCTNTGTWTQVSTPLVGGHSYVLTLTSHDDNYAGDPTFTLYDDVTVSATVPPPPPPPSPIANGDFETGSLAPWTATGSASVATSPVHGGSHSALLGLAGTPTNGDSSIAQTFTASATGGTLSFWYLEACNDSVTYDWATATLKDNTAGTTTTPLARTCTNAGAWVRVSVTLAANHSYTLTLTNHDDNYAGDATYTYFDDVAVN